ncbi:MAG: hypothetical protein AVDCRST_MAG77-1069 [uncultured Chloroflexi bacterium]|uniref:HTH lacI-type domain-containing protein n=1 Tax=uncultured Chloroflexota bacterium TaxID=166587 RepID=A0A6J4HSN2_9CHLR|nr:MAG: hypothetical protein AVDCRST_MAG77-1069 [uncultured Chloroflexota bacterium]
MASLVDVARAAGVSTSTASRALARPEMIGAAAVERVRAAAAALGYVPNPFARSLRAQESKTLGLVVPDSTNPFFAEVARGIEAACFRAGYTLILSNSDRSLEKERQQARVLVEKRVDGVLLFNHSDASAATISWLREQGMPVVLVERRLPAAPGGLVVPGAPGAPGAPDPEGAGRLCAVDCVLSDNAGGVRAALEHLAALGHRRVACLAGDPGAWHYAERTAAFRHVAAALAFDETSEQDGPLALVQPGLTTYADGQRAAAELLAGPRPPTALFCTTDTLAIGATRGAALVGRRVPDDVSVVGFGGTEITGYTTPPLTCVVQEKLAVGTQAVRLLLRRVADRRRPNAEAGTGDVTHVVPTRLLVRGSTGPAPTRSPHAATGKRASALD